MKVIPETPRANKIEYLRFYPHQKHLRSMSCHTVTSPEFTPVFSGVRVNRSLVYLYVL